MAKAKKAKKLDKAKYEEKAKQVLAQRARSNRASQRAPSGYLTKESNKLVPGNGLMSYTYTDKLLKSQTPQQVTSVEPEPTENKPDKSSPQPSIEDGFLGFDDNNSDSDNPLVHQFASFEKDLKDQQIKLPVYPAPWNYCDNTDTITEKLNREIKNYISYMSPQPREVKDRNELVKRIQMAVGQLFHGFECRLFGSSATDMYLPQADVDMVLVPAGNSNFREKSILHSFKAYIKRKGWANDVLVIGRARVPIIKFTDQRTRLNVDISIGQTGGVEAIKVVKAWDKKYSALKPLVVIVKQFLKKRNLSEVFHGGLGGYAVICMVASFLENHAKIKAKEINPLDNLGVLLCEFFEFYGYKLDTNTTALRMTGSMPRVLKRVNSNLQTQKPGLLSIEDPNDYQNNISRSSYNWLAVQKEFCHAFDIMKRMIVEYSDLEPKERDERSFLGVLLKNEIKEDRHSVEVLREKVGQLSMLAANSNFDNKTVAQSKKAAKRERKEKKRRKEEQNKRAKKSRADDDDAHSDEDGSEKERIKDKAVIDLTGDYASSNEENPKIKEIFGAASSSDSDVEVVSVNKAPRTDKDSSSEEEEVSRTKLAKSATRRKSGSIEQRRAFWAQKNGLQSGLDY